MSPESIVAWNLASVSVQGLLYGIFFILFCGSTYLLAFKQHSQSTIANSINVLRSLPFLAGLAFFFTVTGHWIAVVYRSFQAFIYFQSGQDAELFYAELAQPSNFAKTTIMLVALLLADAVLVYRVFVIWNYRGMITLVPLTSFLGNVACCVGTLTELPGYQPGVDLRKSDPWILANIVITVVTNVSCSLLIGYKMWSLRNPKHSQKPGQATIWWLLAMFIENAFLYVVITLAYFIVYQSGSAAQFLIEDTLAPLVGITFMLINVRVGMGYKVASGASDAEDAHFGLHGGENAHGARALAVTVTQVVDRTVDCEPRYSVEKVGARREKRFSLIELDMRPSARDSV